MLDQLLERKDRPAYVTFERRPVENKRETLAQGRWVGQDVDFVLVTPAYSKDVYPQKVQNFFENEEKNVRNGRTPVAHLDFWKESYKRFKLGQEMPLNGTTIHDLTVLSASQRKMLVSVNILTIEDLAACNDEGRRRIGMGAMDMTNKAKAWLQSTQDHGGVVAKIASLEQENNVMRATIETLERQVEALKSQVSQNTFNPYQPLTTQTEETISASDLIDEPGDSPAALYEAKFGKEPHHRMKESTILEALKD